MTNMPTAMPKVELVVADRNWILEEFASRIRAHSTGAIDLSIVDRPSGSADVYYFLPYSVFRRMEGARCGALFTHIEEDFPDARERFFNIAAQCDFCVTMSHRYERRLRESGIEHVTTIIPGVDRDRFFPRLRIGVVGRGYHTGRKNEAMVARLRRLPFVDLHFTGVGWPGRCQHYSDDRLNDFYNSIDYLLVPGRFEGGPMPVLEALAAGTPVIAPDVGFVEQFPHIPYDNSSLESLESVLKELHSKKCSLPAALDAASWETFASAHEQLLAAEAARSPDSLQKHRCPVDEQLRVALVTHGSERTTRGGPTQRVAYTADLLASKGIEARCEFGVAVEPKTADVVHVFNSWPLRTAVETVRSYRKRDLPVVFSPIMLDLSALPTYCELAAAGSRKEVRATLARVTAELRAAAEGTVAPVETCPGHFEAVRECSDAADVVIALSERERRNLLALGVRQEKVHVVRNCVDPRISGREVESGGFRRRYGLDRFFLVVGRVEPRKNLMAICEGLSDLGVTIVSVGATGDQEYRQNITRLYGDKVLFIDRVEDRGLLASAYADCTAYVQYSWAEGASLATLEAYAAGARLIIAPTSGEREYFPESHVDFVEAFDLEALARAGQLALACTETASARAAARALLVGRLEADYVSGTAAAYAVARERGRAQSSRVLYVDVTSYAHAVFNSQTTTGGIALERKLFEAFKAHHGEVTFLVWCHRNNAFFPLDPALATDQTFCNALSSGYWPASDSSITFPRNLAASRRAEPASPAEALPELAGLVEKLDTASLFNRGGLYLALQLVKALLRSLPGFLRSPLVRGIRLMRPKFDLYRSLPGAAPAGSSPARAPSPAQQDPGIGRLDVLAEGARLVVVGNGWISNPRYLDCLHALVTRYRLDVRAIVYDLLPITHRRFFPRSSAERFEAHFRTLAGFASRLYGISDYTVAALASYLRLHRLPSGVELMKLGSTRVRAEPAQVDGLPERYFLCVSSVNQRKNHPMLLQAWDELQKAESRSLRGAKLVLVGKNTFKDMRVELPPNTVHLEDVDDGQLLRIYENCLFTVYPSLAEGFGLPVVESIEYGRPCIASDLPSLAAFSHPAVLKVPPDDYLGWLDAIRLLVCNDAVREALTAECEGFEVGTTWAEVAEHLSAPSNRAGVDVAGASASGTRQKESVSA